MKPFFFRLYTIKTNFLIFKIIVHTLNGVTLGTNNSFFICHIKSKLLSLIPVYRPILYNVVNNSSESMCEIQELNLHIDMSKAVPENGRNIRQM